MVITDMHEIKQVIEINEKNRKIDATEDLIHIQYIHPKSFNDAITVFAPKNWNKNKYKHITQSEYDTKFSTLFPTAKLLLDQIKNIVVAGGAAAKPLYINEKNNNVIDIDIFIYGLSGHEFWRKINEVVNTLIDLSYHENLHIVQKIKQGIIIIIIYDNNDNTYTEYQIILREYITLSSIIHSFDIPSCCIAYDGTNTYVTSLGAYAYSYQINLIYTKYRSPTYEKRLNKYFTRGFALGLIEFSKDIASKSDVWETPYLTMELDERISPTTCIGYIQNMSTNKSLASSDYASIPPFMNNYKDLLNLVKNIELIGLTLTSIDNCNKFIDYTLFYKMKVTDILQNNYNVTHIINKIIKKIKHTNLINLSHLGLSKEVIKQIVLSVFDNNTDDNDIKQIIFDEIVKNGNYIPKWILSHDPDKQFTSSICPIIEDASKWYGSSYEKIF